MYILVGLLLIPFLHCFTPIWTLSCRANQSVALCPTGELCNELCNGQKSCHSCFQIFPTDKESYSCKCNKGYVASMSGTFECMLPQDCPCPGPNEEYQSCNKCERTCDNPEARCILKRKCYPLRKCMCKEGCARNSKGICIAKDKCPRACGQPTPPAIIVPSIEKAKGIHCWNGSMTITGCKQGDEYEQCLVQKYSEKWKSTFNMIKCKPGYTHCYIINHGCKSADQYIHIKGCAQPDSVCSDELLRECPNRKNRESFHCEQCTGKNQCNKGFWILMN